MSSVELFDVQKVDQFESEPTILGFFLYSATINKSVSDYFSSSASDLDVLTGKNFRLFFVPSGDERRVEIYREIGTVEPKKIYNFFTPMREIEPSRITRNVKHNVYAVAALGDYFLASEYFRMPCLVFFSKFDSKQFYVYEVDHLSNEEIAKLVMKLASEAKSVWGDRAVPEGGEERQRIRQQTYDQFILKLKRIAAKEKLRSILKDATILTIVSSAIGLA